MSALHEDLQHNWPLYRFRGGPEADEIWNMLASVPQMCQATPRLSPYRVSHC